MGFIWFWLVAVMIVGYVVLDGFDLGVGVLQCGVFTRGRGTPLAWVVGAQDRDGATTLGEAMGDVVA